MVKDHSDSESGNRCCHYHGYSSRLAARVLLYAPSHRQDSTYHNLCYTSHEALAAIRNSSMTHYEGSIRADTITEPHIAPSLAKKKRKKRGKKSRF